MTEAEASKSVVSAETNNEVEIDKTSLAWKYFNAFLEGSDLHASEDELLQYAATDLKVDLSKISPELKDHLAVLIVHFMNMWSGWEFKTNLDQGQFTPEQFFIRFHKFMIHKINVTIRSHFDQAVKLMAAEGVELKRRNNSQANSDNIDVGFAPFCISIRCPPYMLNTLVFSSSGDDITMKQHLGTNWKDLTMSQLLNWPNIEVSLSTDDISFTRRQATQYFRYLNFFPHDSIKKDNDIIEHAEHISNHTRVAYSVDFLEQYSREYLEALKTLKHINSEKLQETQTLLFHFIEDVKHINVNNSIATHTKILFNLSPVPFIRNKKLVKCNGSNSSDDGARVGYCEIISPKIELTVKNIVIHQLDSRALSFPLIEQIKAYKGNTPYAFMPKISYKCTFCQSEFIDGVSRKQLQDHLRYSHKMEQHVRCTVCRKQYDVMSLAACRWKHKCSS